MRTKHLIGIDIDLELISETQLKYYYKDLACEKFKKSLESLELKDLMI